MKIDLEGPDERRPMGGTMVSAEFVVTKESDDDMEPGTYITIRLDEDYRIRAGRVRIDYVDENK